MQPGEPDVRNKARDELNRFARVVWGNAQAVRCLHSAGFEYIELEGYMDGFRELLGPTIKEGKILVRDEYRTALQTLETDAVYEQGAYVTGQPGIGKSLFLVYLLVELLGRCQKVAVYCPGMGGYAIFTDTVAFYPLTNTLPLRSGDRIWALSDSRGNHKTVPCCFYSNLRYTLPIQTTSPRKERWHNWSKEAGAECYVMDIWSEQEIANLALLLELNGGRLVSLHKKWGGSARLLLSYLKRSDQQIERGYALDAALAIRTCQNTTATIEESRHPEDAPAKFYFCRPFNYGKPSIDRMFYCTVVPTSTICHILAAALLRLQYDERLRFFHALCQVGQTRSAAGYIYESLFQIFFAARNSIDCYWSQHRVEATTLRGPTTVVSTPSDELQGITHLPYYWVAPSNFKGIDGALISEEAIYAFQLTISAKHKEPTSGLHELRSSLPPSLQNLPWNVVFIGDTESSVKAVAKHWQGKISFPTTTEHLPVAWSHVDPVAENAPYKIIGKKELTEVDDDDE